LVVDPFHAGEWLLERAREMAIECQAPQPLVMGRHLIQLGMEPGPALGSVLEECFNRQIDGEFSTLANGLECARSILDRDAITGST
jgi:tRNA nucleotidyltransferase (CCA-adding enzyme)